MSANEKNLITCRAIDQANLVLEIIRSNGEKTGINDDITKHILNLRRFNLVELRYNLSKNEEKYFISDFCRIYHHHSKLGDDQFQNEINFET